MLAIWHTFTVGVSIDLKVSLQDVHSLCMSLWSELECRCMSPFHTFHINASAVQYTYGVDSDVLYLSFSR